MNFITNIASSIADNVWTILTGTFPLGSDDDNLDLVDSENGHCYLRRRTPESQREFQSIEFANVCRAGGRRRRVGVRPALANEDLNTLRKRSRRFPPPDNVRTPRSRPDHQRIPNKQEVTKKDANQLGEPSKLPANQSRTTDFVEATTSTSVVSNHSSAHSNSTNDSQLAGVSKSCDEPLASKPSDQPSTAVSQSCKSLVTVTSQPEEPLISVVNSQVSPSESEKALLESFFSSSSESFKPLEIVQLCPPEEPLSTVDKSQTSSSESEKALLESFFPSSSESSKPLEIVQLCPPEEPLSAVDKSQTSSSESEKVLLESFVSTDTVPFSPPEEPSTTVDDSQTSPSESEKALLDSFVPSSDTVPSSPPEELTTVDSSQTSPSESEKALLESFVPSSDTIPSSPPEELTTVDSSQTSPSESEKALLESFVPSSDTIPSSPLEELTTVDSSQTSPSESEKVLLESFVPSSDTVPSSPPEETLTTVDSSQTSLSESEKALLESFVPSVTVPSSPPEETLTTVDSSQTSPSESEKALLESVVPSIAVPSSPSESEKALLSFVLSSGAAQSSGTLPTSSPILEEVTLSQPEKDLISFFDSQTSSSEGTTFSGTKSLATPSPALIETTPQALISDTKTSLFDPEKTLTLDSLSGPSPLLTSSATPSSTPPEEPLTASVDSKPSPTDAEFDNISLEDNPSTTISDANMWKNPYPTGFTGSSHEFFDSFGLADSNTASAQSRGSHTTSHQTSQASSTPTQFFEQNFEAMPTAYHVSTQATNIVAELFQPTDAHSFVASTARPEQVGNHENPPPVQAPTQAPMTASNQASFQALTSAHTGINNSLQLPYAGTGAEQLENIEGYSRTTNQVLSQDLNRPTLFQTTEHPQKGQQSLPAQASNATASLFQPFQTGDQSFPPRTVDPFGAAMKMTPSNAAGTSQLFAAHQHDDPFDSLSVGTQNYGMPPSTESGYGNPAFPSSSNIQKQHSVERLETYSGATNAQTWPLDQIGQSDLQFNTGHSHVESNVHEQSVHDSNDYPRGDTGPSYPPRNSDSYSSMSTQNVDNATSQFTGKTLPAKVAAGLDVIKTTDTPAAGQQPAATVEPVSISDHAPFQPPASSLYPPTMVNGFQDPKFQTSSLYPPGLLSSQPVSQATSLYPPGMDLGESSSIFSSSMKEGVTEPFTPDPNLLPPKNPGFVDGGNSAETGIASQSALTVASSGVQPTAKDFVDNHSGTNSITTPSLQSDRMSVNPDVSGYGQFTNDPESNQLASERPNDALLMKNLEENQIASNPPSQSEPVSTNRIDYEAQSEPLSQQMSLPVAEPVVTEKTSTAVYAETGTPLLDPSGIAPPDRARIPPTSQQSAPLQHAQSGTPHLDTKLAHDGTLPSVGQEFPPSQTVAEPGRTEAVHAGTPHLDTTTVVAHGTLPPSQAPPLGTQSTMSSRDSKPLDDKLTSKQQHALPFGTQHENTATTMFSSADTVPYNNTSLSPSHVVSEAQGELQGSPLESDANPHPSAFIPVKATSPRHREGRENLESPLRSPVEREKKEALLHGQSIQTSSLWDSEPQLAIRGLIVPTATRGNHETSQSALKSQATVPAQASKVPSNVVKPTSGIPGFTQTVYPFTTGPIHQSKQHPLTSTDQIQPGQPGAYQAVPSNQRPSSNQELPFNQGPSANQELPSNQAQQFNQELNSTTSPESETSTHGSTSNLSRQSSYGISGQADVTGKTAQRVGDKLSGLDYGKTHRPNSNQVPSVYDRPSSGQASDHPHRASTPESGLSQHTSSHSTVQTGLPQNEASGRRMVSGYGGFDGHTDRPAGTTTGAHGSGQSDVIVTQHGTSQNVVTERGYGASDGQVSGQGKGMVAHPGPNLQQQQLQYQQQYQQQLYLHQQNGHMEQQQKAEHDQYMQQQLLQQQQLHQQLYNQQQLQQHQELQRQASGVYQQHGSGNQHYASTQYQTTADTEQQQQQYADFDSEDESNRYYDESRKWFWSYKRNKWIRADKSKREQEQYYDERYHRSGSARSRHDDNDRRKRRHRRRDGSRHGRRSDYDETYYDKYYYDRDYQRRESVSSESSDDSQRRVSRSGRSSRAESPRSVSSRSSSRARRSRRSKHREYEYEDGYRKDEDYYHRSRQSSRNSRRRSSSSYSSTTSNSLGDNIKWDNEPIQQQSGQITTEYPIERVVTPERLTPKQHSVPHIVGKFASVSRLSLAPPRRILDGEAAEVFVTDVTSDPRPCQMQRFPGPLCRTKSHKRDVVKFANDQALAAFNNQSKSFEEREASYILWKVLALMVQQNGVYLNGDIAEVLTSDLPTSELGQSPHSSRRVSFSSEDQVFSSVASQQDQEAAYRELLLCGKTQEALELAVASKMWGHALILSHNLDPNIFANIMNRFTNTLDEDDSLLCLYQHLSQKTPSVLDKRSRQWRKHLAIMIANPSKSPEQDRRNIFAMGENLESRGLIEAAHLCYILAGGTFWKEDGSVLLGYSLNGVRPDFVDILALQRTELFEYAMSLREENYIMHDFQPWKAFYAHMLADAGLHVKAFRYCETMLNNMLKYPTFFTDNTITQIYALSVRLTEREHMTPFFDMNIKMKQILDLMQGKEIAPQRGTDMQNQQEFTQYGQPSTQQPLNQPEAREDTSSVANQTSQVHQSINGNDQNSVPMIPTMFVPNMTTNMGQEQAYANNLMANPQEQNFFAEGNQAIPFAQPVTTGQSDQYNTPYTSEQLSPPGNYPYRNNATSEVPPLASFSYENVSQAVPSNMEHDEAGLPNTHTDLFEGDSFEHLLRREPSAASVDTSGATTSDNSFDYYAQSNFRTDNSSGQSAKKEEKSETDGKKPEKNEKKDDSKKEKEASGFIGSIGGFFKSFIPKGKNEMILPDDKKKSIYWDEKLGKWVDTDGTEEDKTDLPPPPIDPSLVSAIAPTMPPVSGERPTLALGTSGFNTPTSAPPSSQQPPVASAPPALPGNFTPEQPEVSLVNTPLTTPSRFSRRALGSKGRRSNYVDVLSASGSTTKLNQTASPLLFSPFPTNTVTNNFVPDNQPSTDNQPGPVISENNVPDNTAEEETASAQSSELEVSQPAPTVPFFNPSNYTAAPSSPATRGRLYPRTKK